MTPVLGSTTCGVLGCNRARHTSADGRIVYGRCLAHTLILMSSAFGGDRHDSPPSATPASPRGRGVRQAAVA